MGDHEYAVTLLHHVTPSDLKVHCAWQVVNQALWIVRAEWDDVGCIGSQLAALF